MPLVKVWIHLIWSTKNRKKLIVSQLKSALLNHIKENAVKKSIFIDTVNCVSDHIHMVISLKGDQSISKVLNLIKGESSYWVNKSELLKVKFEWQDEYIAISVSESQLESVRNYIENQEEHHKLKTFAEEYDLFVKKYGFEKLTTTS
jgi:putative transposase